VREKEREWEWGLVGLHRMDPIHYIFKKPSEGPVAYLGTRLSKLCRGRGTPVTGIVVGGGVERYFIGEEIDAF
jgi:hypothetical protein